MLSTLRGKTLNAHEGVEVKKIISLFQRNYYGNRRVRNEVVPGAEWVIAGEGVATRKWDGACCMIENGRLFKRYDAKKFKIPPEGFIPAQELPDANTGHWPGWLEVGDGPEDKWFREALINNDAEAGDYEDGTYELVGPKVQGNPDGFSRHILISHGASWLSESGGWPQDVPRTYESLKQWLAENDVEGIVWHRENGDMVKIKAKDFGLKR